MFFYETHTGEDQWFQEQLRNTEKTQSMIKHYQKFRSAVQLGSLKNDKYQIAILKETMVTKSEVEVDDKGEMMNEARWIAWSTTDPLNPDKVSIPNAQAQWDAWMRDPASCGMLTDVRGLSSIKQKQITDLFID